ncbi:MAG: hypothetical protein HKP61_01655 [Dactylosporangium sp.]|nr:hypothetical protein [Dactylosporangium sp.]NNJ59669.1 hypothetical protein [Dactylosporangium sp.]
MAYTIPPTAPSPRPGVVTAGAGLVGLVAVLQLLSALMSLIVAGDLGEVYEQAFEGESGGDTAVSVAMATSYITIGINIIIGAALGVLASLNAKGKQVARIITWVVGGLYLCCSSVGLAFTAAGSAMTSTGDTGGVDSAEFERLMNDLVPSWYSPMSTTVSVVSVIAMVAAVILLALPAANVYFRKPVQQWEPPIPPAGLS